MEVPPEELFCLLLRRASPLPSSLSLKWSNGPVPMTVNLEPSWRKRSEQPSASSFCPHSCLMAFPGPRPRGKPASLGDQAPQPVPQPVSTVLLLLLLTMLQPAGVDNVVYSSSLGSGPDTTGMLTTSLPHSVAAAAAAAAGQPSPGYCVAFGGRGWLAGDGQPSGGHDPHSLTRASCAACVWQQEAGPGTGWILNSEAIPEQCIGDVLMP